ncbi:MAG: hypothetical protein MZU97_18330 [Bacillus subtilis]|nr:hypothetical protein [Bacillus subtilis]
MTSRAIMGILAGNAIVEDGKIIYEGLDLTKVDEEHFHEIRGKKIGMIFQDPNVEFESHYEDWPTNHRRHDPQWKKASQPI